MRKYESKDFKDIKSWADHYGLDIHEAMLPPIGFIEEDLAAYFLYETPSTICYMENLIANPHADPEAREQGIKNVTDGCLKEASIKGFKVAYACTSNPAVIARAASRNCYVKAGYALIRKDLSNLN